MKETISEYRFVSVMLRHGFSTAGAQALFKFLEDFEADTGEEMEFDPVGLRCSFREFRSALDAARDFYGSREASAMTEEEAASRLCEDSGAVMQIEDADGAGAGCVVQVF